MLNSKVKDTAGYNEDKKSFMIGVGVVISKIVEFYNERIKSLKLQPTKKKSEIYTSDLNPLVRILEAYWSNGNLMRRWNYLNGQLHGLSEEYYSNGNLRYRENRLNGKLHGLSEGYYENGTLEYRENYLNGDFHGLSEGYYEDGNLRYRRFYLL